MWKIWNFLPFLIEIEQKKKQKGKLEFAWIFHCIEEYEFLWATYMENTNFQKSDLAALALLPMSMEFPVLGMYFIKSHSTFTPTADSMQEGWEMHENVDQNSADVIHGKRGRCTY